MIILFYIFSVMAVALIICMITSCHPVHALLYLIGSLLFISCDLFFLNAPFAAAIEVIVYAGAIMVLFLFFIMMIDMKNIVMNMNNKEFIFSPWKIFDQSILLIISLSIILFVFIFEIKNCFINTIEPIISIKQIGITLFGPYMLIVEMASMLLLGALISILHISHYEDNVSNNISVFKIHDKR